MSRGKRIVMYQSSWLVSDTNLGKSEFIEIYWRMWDSQNQKSSGTIRLQDEQELRELWKAKKQKARGRAPVS